MLIDPGRFAILFIMIILYTRTGSILSRGKHLISMIRVIHKILNAPYDTKRSNWGTSAEVAVTVMNILWFRG